MIVDTGSTMLELPPHAVVALDEALKDNEMYRANFSRNFLPNDLAERAKQNPSLAELDAALPPLSLNFWTPDGIATLTLPATKSYLVPMKGPTGELYCISPVIEQDVATRAHLSFGAAAMRGHVVVFDREHKRIGFVEHDSCQEALPALYPEDDRED